MLSRGGGLDARTCHADSVGPVRAGMANPGLRTCRIPAIAGPGGLSCTDSGPLWAFSGASGDFLGPVSASRGLRFRQFPEMGADGARGGQIPASLAGCEGWSVRGRASRRFAFSSGGDALRPPGVERGAGKAPAPGGSSSEGATPRGLGGCLGYRGHCLIDGALEPATGFGSGVALGLSLAITNGLNLEN